MTEPTVMRTQLDRVHSSWWAFFSSGSSMSPMPGERAVRTYNARPIRPKNTTMMGHAHRIAVFSAMLPW